MFLNIRVHIKKSSSSSFFSTKSSNRHRVRLVNIIYYNIVKATGLPQNHWPRGIIYFIYILLGTPSSRSVLLYIYIILYSVILYLYIKYYIIQIDFRASKYKVIYYIIMLWRTIEERNIIRHVTLAVCNIGTLYIYIDGFFFFY